MEMDEIDILALSMLRHFKQVQNTQKSRLACQLRRDIRKSNGFHGVDLDRALFHAISSANSHMRAHPDSNAAGDLSPTNSFSKPFGKHHGKSLQLQTLSSPSIGKISATSCNKMI